MMCGANRIVRLRPGTGSGRKKRTAANMPEKTGIWHSLRQRLGRKMPFQAVRNGTSLSLWIRQVRPIHQTAGTWRSTVQIQKPSAPIRRLRPMLGARRGRSMPWTYRQNRCCTMTAGKRRAVSMKDGLYTGMRRRSEQEGRSRIATVSNRTLRLPHRLCPIW